MKDENSGYAYFLRTHPVVESDPLVQEIRAIYSATHDGLRAKDGTVRHVLWRLLHERRRFPSLRVAVEEWQRPTSSVSAKNGLRHDWRKSRATWLYSGYGTSKGDRGFWLASQRMMHWPSEKIDAYLNRPEVKDHSTSVIVCCNTGLRPHMAERPFMARRNEQRVLDVLQQIIAADKAPICWLMSQEFFLQELKRDHKKLLSHLQSTIELVADYCHFAVPFRELGEIYGGGEGLERRNEMFLAMRKAAPHLPLACHERPLCEITAMDFRDVEGDVISLCQTGFKTPTGGRNRPQDRVTSPDKKHTYDGSAGFVRANGRRMRDRQLGGQMERHTNALGEASIPLVFRGQPWMPTRSLSNAQRRARRILQCSGASFDLSAGATLE